MEQIKSAMGSIGSTLGMRQEDPNSFFGILKQEHEAIKRNLDRILNASRPLTDLFMETEDALNKHMKGEEDVLYPKLQDNAATRQMAYLSYEEHNAMKQLLAGMAAASADSDRWMAKVRLLDIILGSHVSYEEGQVFPKAKEIMFQNSEMNMRQQYLNEKAAPQPTAPPAAAPPPTPP